jgi:hypothetical protein
MLVTCSTFALYSAHFTKSVNQGITALAQADGDHSAAPMQKRYVPIFSLATISDILLQMGVPWPI